MIHPSPDVTPTLPAKPTLKPTLLKLYNGHNLTGVLLTLAPVMKVDMQKELSLFIGRAILCLQKTRLSKINI